MKDYIRLSVTLLVICAVAAALLSVTNEKTIGVIARRAAEDEAAALKEILPKAVRFAERSAPADPSLAGLIKELGLEKSLVDSGGKKVLKFQAALDGEGDGAKQIGVALRIAPQGFSGAITMMVGIDTSAGPAALSVAGLKILDHTETPGLGANMKEVKASMVKKLAADPNLPFVSAALASTADIGAKQPWFQLQFTGLKAEGLKVDKDGGTVHSITAATISSRAVTRGISNAMNLYKGILALGEVK